MSAAPQRQNRLTPPRLVNTAFWLFMLAALTRLVSLIISIASFGGAEAIAKRQLSKSGMHLSESALHASLVGTFIGGIIFSILFIVAFVLFDVFMRRGANWARIVLTVLTVLSIFSAAGGYGVNAVGVVASIVAVVLMYLRASNSYFAEAKALKAGGPSASY
jgi:hypothetical protein